MRRRRAESKPSRLGELGAAGTAPSEACSTLKTVPALARGRDPLGTGAEWAVRQPREIADFASNGDLPVGGAAGREGSKPEGGQAADLLENR